MKVLVTGGRTYANQQKAFKVLDYLHKHIGISCIVESGVNGADKIAFSWARIVRGVAIRTYTAEWDKF